MQYVYVVCGSKNIIFNILYIIVAPLCSAFLKCVCNKVRRKEGSGQGWLVKTQVCLFKTDKLTQVRTLRHPETSTLSFVSAITLCIRSDCFSLTARALESSLRLSLNCHSTAAFIRSPRQLLQSDTGDPHFALDPLTYRCLLSLSPAADFAEPRLPSPHTPTARLRPGSPPACSPPPPHSWRGSRLQSSASPACGSPWIWRAVMPDTNGWSARWYPSCGGATARGRGPNRGWIPVPGDNSGGWGPPTGSPNTPSQWCCTSSLS